jgi:hypothetical protein
MTISGTINGAACDVFIDSGAEGWGGNFISEAFARELHLPIVPSSTVVRLGDDHQRTATGKATACLRLRATNGILKRTMDFTVLPMPRHHHIILGVPWLQEFNPDINWHTDTIVTRLPSKHNFVFRATRRARPGAVDLQLMDADAFERFVGSPDVEEVFLCYIKSSDDIASRVGKEVSASHLPADIHPDIRKLLEKYSAVFPEKLPEGLPRHKFRHHIKTAEGVEPYCRYPYRFSLPELQELDSQLSDLLPAGRIRKSSSPWGAPILFARKKDGGLRMCVDYRVLNKRTVKDKYPLPRTQECIDKLSKASVFTSLDLASGFWQIPMAEADIHKTAFVTPRGQFEWTVMPFGLCNAPSTFQSMMDEVLREFLNDFAVVYMDDVLIYSNSWPEHLDHLDKIFQRFEEHGLYCKPHKCDFGKAEVKFLGFLVGNGCVRIDDSAFAAVRNWPTPTNVTAVRSFMGFLNHYRHYIPGLSGVAAPLSTLQSPKVEWHWGEDEDNAFKKLKDLLCSSHVLRLFDHDRPTRVVTDASNAATGACLLQLHDDGWRPVAYDSSKLNSAQRNYSTYDRELLAIHRALMHWRHYLLGHHFEVITDHATLRHLVNQPEIHNSRRIRWVSDFQEFDFDILYAPGKTNPADPLSRLNYTQSANLPQASFQYLLCVDEAFVEFKAMNVSSVEIDPTVRARIIASYARDPFYSSPTNLERLEQHNGLYLLHGRICIPDDTTLRRRLLREFHEAPYSGHHGIKRTLDAAARVYWWPRMGHEVREYVNSCLSCQQNKVKNTRPSGLLQPLDVPSRRWEDLSLDFIIHLPPSPSTGNDAILVVVDRLSKGVHLIPCSTTITAQQTADLFIKEIFRLHGLPKSLVSDRDSRFTSDFWTALFSKLGTRLRMSSGYHPQTDGQTERMNRTLEEMLRAYCGHESRQQLWEDYLPIMEFEINNAVNSSTGFSPFFLWYGQHPNTPATMAVERDPPTLRMPAATQDFLQHIEGAVQAAKDSIARAQRTMKDYYDRKRQHITFSVGETVFVEKWGLPENRRGNKLSPLRHGPFKVKRIINPVAYELDVPATWHLHNVFHVSFLTPAKPHREGTPVSVLDVRTYRNQRQIKIRFEEFGSEGDAWLPEADVRTRFPAFYLDYIRGAAVGLFSLSTHDLLLRFI